MNITVFGASGGIGAHAVALAAERGHRVGRSEIFRAKDNVSAYSGA
jgi:nucleoside-diphosphate-sugar epimerase